MDELDALYAFLVAMVVASLLTRASSRLAVRLGAVDEPRDRGLADRATPRLGGLAILCGVLVAGAIFLPAGGETRGILAGAALVTLVGALDDVADLAPQWKLAGQVGACLIPVLSGVRVDAVTLPFLGRLDLAGAGGVLTLIGLVAVVNVVNFSDGIDGLAAGVCVISAIAFAIIAFDLAKPEAAILAALTAGAALGFLFHNFHPASAFMGDSGSNLLGLLLGCVVVQGALKTNAVIALILPLMILAVPFLDTGFVVARRIKYRRPIYRADAQHFHHRFSRIGFSQRRTVLYLYAWTVIVAGVALALRFVPYSDEGGHLRWPGAGVMIGLFVLALAASAYLVYVLEILKFKRVRSTQLRGLDPGTDEHEIAAEVERELETGEFDAVRPSGAGPRAAPAPARREAPEA